MYRTSHYKNNTPSPPSPDSKSLLNYKMVQSFSINELKAGTKLILYT